MPVDTQRDFIDWWEMPKHGLRPRHWRCRYGPLMLCIVPGKGGWCTSHIGSPDNQAVEKVQGLQKCKARALVEAVRWMRESADEADAIHDAVLREHRTICRA